MASEIKVPESGIYYNKGTTAYVKDGVIYQNAPNDSVLVSSSSDLELLTSYEPGTLAFTAGYVHMWQKGVDGTWTQIV